jgi:2-polyprenyl-3-methyl-5-hydroxy-6-metoxy-1,4-benzoquinol methylase
MASPKFKTNPDVMVGASYATNRADFSDEIAWNDHKLSYVIEHAAGKDVLDIGCVDHDPAAYQSKYWVHKALKLKARSLIGMDLSEDGVDYLQAQGYNVIHGDAQAFDLGRKFDVIVAGDLMEHLEDFGGFLDSCKRHLNPGGAIIVSTPNPWWWKYVVKSILSNEVANHPEHTCWLCPRTLRQLVSRHGMDIRDIRFGSRYARDRYMPLPRGIKHASWHAKIVVA